MAFENVNLFYAKNKYGEIIKIYNLSEEDRKEEYYCPLCMSKVIPRLGEKMSHHFAHIDASKCTNESFIHFWVKNKLLEKGDNFKVMLSECDYLEFKCKDILIEKQYKTPYGIYKPDITVITENDEEIYFEIAYTNKKRIDEYYDKWDDLNKMVIEISAKELINGNDIREFKCIYYNHNIYNFQYKDYKNTSEYKDYKNNIFDSCDIIEAEKRLEKIDWFWQECMKRRMNKISDEDFFDIIDNLQVEDRLYVIDKILKSNCTDVRWLYLFNKQKEIKDKIIDFINKNKEACNALEQLEVKVSKDLVHREIFHKNFQMPNVYVAQDEYVLFRYYSDYFNDDVLYTQLNNFMLVNNNYLRNRIDEINKIFNEIYPLYNLSINNVNKNYTEILIDINYSENNISQIKIEDIKETDILKISTYKIDGFRKNLNEMQLKDEILNYINNKKEIISNLNYINDEQPRLEINRFRENEIVVYINIYKQHLGRVNNYVFLVINNEIRCPNGVYRFNNIENFKNIADDLICNKIRELRLNNYKMR